jgi:hypothetical protein
VGIDAPYSALNTVRFERKAGSAVSQVSYEVLDFPQAVAASLERVRAQKETPDGLGSRGPVAHSVRIFALGRACLQKGLMQPGAALIHLTIPIPDGRAIKEGVDYLLPMLQECIGNAVLDQAEAAAVRVPWTELRETYAHFDKRFPKSSRIAFAREAAAVLDRMIAEEAAHRPKSVAEMSVDEQVAEQIYQLQNLGFVQWVMNERYPLDARMNPGEPVMTPVHRLVDLGMAAVPRLIAALDDHRFTRSPVHDWHGSSYSKVMRVNEVALYILEHLSGRSFYPVTDDDGRLKRGTARQQAEAWWKEVQRRGERQVLVAATSAGGEDAAAAARVLVRKYPDAAPAALRAGMRATKSEVRRGEIVRAGAELTGKPAIAFFQASLKPGEGLFAQVQAAEALFALKQPQVVPAMIATWLELQPRLPGNLDEDAYAEIGELIAFLARSGDVRAIKALAQTLPKAPVDVRLAIVQVFAPFPKNGDSVSGVGRVYANGDMADLPGGAAGEAIEELLVNALEDEAWCFGPQGRINGVRYSNPRLCEMAALVLTQRWPDKYPFRWVAVRGERAQQIDKIRNRWRADHGLPPVPPPAAVVPAAPEAEVARLLEAFAAAPNDAGRAAVTAEIDKALGLAALPAVQARFEQAKTAAWRELAVHLANRVREVRVVADIGGAAKKTGVIALQGQPLDRTHLLQLAHKLEATLPPGACGVHLDVERVGDGTGFAITVAWLPGSVKKPTGWWRGEVVADGESTLYATNGYTMDGAVEKVSIYRNFGDMFDRALRAGIDAPVVVQLRLKRSGEP